MHRYVTERTADANSWQILQRKAHFIAQAMSDPEQMTRDLRDESVATVAEEFATIAAIATGDHRHIELAALTAATTRLERAERAHHASRDAQRRNISDAERTVGRLTDQITTIDGLRPHDADPIHIGQQLMRVPWSQRTTLQLAGVAYEARREDGVRLDIPGTGIWARIDGDKLHPADEGRGLGQRILNLHDRLPTIRAERVELIELARRQIDAERARPVPDDFPRRDELADARQRRDELRVALIPKPEEAAAQTADTTSSTSPAAAPGGPATAASTVGAGHPIYGQRQAPTAERFAWSAAYERYDPSVVHWGNRAHGVDAWVAAVNTFSLDPANWHTTRRHDIGQFHGVSLHARCNDTAVHIEPRHPYAKNGDYPTYTAQPGRIDPTGLSMWLAAQRSVADAERAALRAQVSARQQSAAHHQPARFNR